MDRRLFLRCTGCTALAMAATQTGMLPEILGGIKNTYAFDNTSKLSSVEARYYKKLPEGGIECNICPRHCMVTDLERGYCGTRENRDDDYYTLVYGLPCALNIDPIEKKPLYHFYPGTNAFSLATAGCNVNCKFCQNWDISQTRPEQLENYSLSIEEAINVCKTRSVPTIAYTYSEPVIFYEYMYDMAKLGQKNGIRSVMITGGYIDELPLAELMPQLDAIKVDLKSIREDYYRDIVDGELKPVLDRLIQIKKAGMWLELVYLIVPTLNDTDAEFKELAVWIKENLGVETPLHFSRFFPKYLLTNLPATPPSTMERAYQICKAEGLHYVYLGNIRGNKAESTYCPKCETLLIERQGYKTTLKNIDGDRCKICNHQIPGRF